MVRNTTAAKLAAKPERKEGGSSKTDEKKANIIVAVRVRPEAERERAEPHKILVRVMDEKVLVFDPSDEDPNQRRVPGHRRAKNLKFAFDRVFDQYATQDEVYEHTAKHLLDDVMDGYNATVFAYGATGAGKTHTMIGNCESGPGVMVQCLRSLYKKIEYQKESRSYKVLISYLEVYNETIRDLLVEESPAFDVREDPKTGVTIHGLTQHRPESPEELFGLLEKGNLNRTQAPTDANASSSRSHAVLQIFIHQKPRTADVSTTWKIGKLCLVDLAGSERAVHSKNRGATLKEGANINKSLLALGNCINALGEKGGNAKYIPYRDSKLTRLLKDSLGGNCRTVMIANISPSSLCSEDSHNTLKYANRAKNIKTKISRNVVNVDAHIYQYKEIIKDLRGEVTALKSQINENGSEGLDDDSEEKEMMQLQSAIQRVFDNRLKLKKEMLSLQQLERDRLRQRNRIQKDIQKANFIESQNDTSRSNCSPQTSLVRLERENTLSEKALSELNTKKQKTMQKIEDNLKDLNIIRKTIERPNHLHSMRRRYLEQELRAREAELEKLELRALCSAKETSVQNQSDRMKALEKNIAALSDIVVKQYTILKGRGYAMDENLIRDISYASADAEVLLRSPTSPLPKRSWSQSMTIGDLKFDTKTPSALRTAMKTPGTQRRTGKRTRQATSASSPIDTSPYHPPSLSVTFEEQEDATGTPMAAARSGSLPSSAPKFNSASSSTIQNKTTSRTPSASRLSVRSVRLSTPQSHSTKASSKSSSLHAKTPSKTPSLHAKTPSSSSSASAVRPQRVHMSSATRKRLERRLRNENEQNEDPNYLSSSQTRRYHTHADSLKGGARAVGIPGKERLISKKPQRMYTPSRSRIAALVNRIESGNA